MTKNRLTASKTARLPPRCCHHSRTIFRNPSISRNPSQPTRKSRVKANPRISIGGPFGEVIKKTGVVSGQPFGFSTKYQDAEIGLLYYGYRYLGINGWLNRDPVNELGLIMLVDEGTGYDLEPEENLYRFVNNTPVMLVDKDGRIIPVIVVAGVAITIEEAAFIGATICSASPSCRAAAVQAAQAAIAVVNAVGTTVCGTRCRFGNHPPDHSWDVFRWGIPPWKRCWFNHIQLNCWIQRGPLFPNGLSLLELRIPYGPCYKYRNASPPVTH